MATLIQKQLSQLKLQILLAARQTKQLSIQTNGLPNKKNICQTKMV